MALRNVAIIGASGNIGRFILRALQDNAAFKTTVVTRQSSKAQFGDTNVLRVEDSYPSSEMIKAFTGQDAVILALPFQAYDSQERIIDSAIKAGVKRLIPSHFGGNAENLAMLELESRASKMDSIIDHLRSKESEGLTWTTIVTGIFFDLALLNGFLGYNISKREAMIWDDGSSTFSCSTCGQIANAVVAVLERPELTANQVVYMSSFETSQNQILTCLEKVTGDSWKTTKVDRQSKIREARATLSSGIQGHPMMMAHGTLSLAAMFGEEKYGADFTKTGRLWNKKLGLNHQDMENVVRALLEHGK